MAEKSAETLLAELDSPQAAVRADAAVAVGERGLSEAARRLAALADDGDATVRLSAVYALGELREIAQLDAVKRLSRDVDERVRAEAALALGKLGVADAVPDLVRLLSDSFHLARREAAVSLGSLRDRSSLPALAQCLEDRSPEVRLEAAAAMAAMGDSRSFEPLVEALGITRYASDAVEGLSMLGDPRAIEALQLLDKRFFLGRLVKLQALAVRARLGDPSAPPLILAKLRARKLDERGYALMLVAELNLPEAREALEAVLARRGDYHRDTAARALGVLGDRSAVPALMQVLREGGNTELLADACAALGQLGAREAQAELAAIADDEANEAELREAAGAALQALDAA